MTTTHPSDFRPDINGLRTWAVLAVVLYHFHVPGFNGGFVGVDVFFVISGYLMTGIVVRGLDQDRFSLIGFYLARARRILPALLVLCASLLALGWFFLLPPDYKLLGTHAVTAITFWSNFRFLDEAGYFDSSSNEKWLLHTWSLSVEWQFYLLLPLLLWAIWKIKPGFAAQKWAVGLGLVCSLLACLWFTHFDTTQAFYGLHTRAWELLAGGLVFLWTPKVRPSPAMQRNTEIIGLVLIVMAVIMFDAQTSWPGYRALLPVAGATMVLWAQRSSSVFTGTQLAQWAGDRSYSIYLWHWPMVVVLVYINALTVPLFIVCGVVMTLILAALSYRLIETPSRTWLLHSKPHINFLRLGLCVCLVFVAGVAIWKFNGVEGRFSKSAELAAAESLNVNPKNCITPDGIDVKPCRYGGPITKLILLGDSHSGAVATALEAALPSRESGFEQWGYAACPMIFGVQPTPGTWTAKRKNYHCAEFVDNAVTKLKDVDTKIPVLIVTRTSLAIHGLNEAPGHNPPEFFIGKATPTATTDSVSALQSAYVKTVCEIAKSRKVYLMRPIPEMGVNIPKMISRRIAMGLDTRFELTMDAYQNRNRDALIMQDNAVNKCGAIIFDPTIALCRGNHCQSTDKNRPLYADDDHLSEYGNKYLLPVIRQIRMFNNN